MNYDRKVPALLQSKASITESISIAVKREFVEGYVLSSKLRKFGIDNPMLVSANQPEQAEDTYVKVKVIVDDNTTA
jgi:hypothetical protein